MEIQPKKPTQISDSANPKIDVLYGWSTLMFSATSLSLAIFKNPSSICIGAGKKLELLTPSSFLPIALLRFYSEQHEGWLLQRRAKYVDNSFSVSSCPLQLYRLRPVLGRMGRTSFTKCSAEESYQLSDPPRSSRSSRFSNWKPQEWACNCCLQKQKMGRCPKGTWC